MTDLNELRDKAHTNAVKHGFWNKELSNQHCLMLVITELSEAIEADRKGDRANKVCFDTCIANAYQGIVRSDWFTNSYNRCIKNSLEDELADTFIRLLDLAGARCIDIELKKYSPKGDYPFTELVYSIITQLSMLGEVGFTLKGIIDVSLSALLGLSLHMGIDLLWFVEQKMKYNEFRPIMHGKKY